MVKNGQQQRRWSGAIATSLLMIVLGCVGAVNIALSRNVSPPKVLKNTTMSHYRSRAPDQSDRELANRHQTGFGRDGQHDELDERDQQNQRGQSVQPVQRNQHQQNLQPLPIEKAKQLNGFKPRLPAYYSRLVTPVQRERIYWIQQRYFLEIQKYQQHIEKLETERDKVIHRVLTPDQQERLRQLSD